MRLREVYNPYRKSMRIQEQREKEVTLLILTRNEQERGFTARALKKRCERRGFSCFYVFSDEAFIFDREADDTQLTIHNFDGQEKKLVIDPTNTACFVRGSVMDNEAGLTMLRSIQESGVFMINTHEAMHLARNKLLSSMTFKKNDIPHPRTSFVNNDQSIDLAVEAIGGEFPIIIKTLTGTEGIGVIKVDKRDSLAAILQALWGQEAETLIQEYIPIDFDIRTLVLAGEIIGSTMRKKIEGDFRTNLSLGAETIPYILGDEDKEIILETAKTIGAYFVGVDHAISKKGAKKERFVLEANGSPGIQSDFGLDNKDKIPLGRLLNTLIDTARDKETWKGFSSESVGTVEEVDIEGVGKVSARLDTGNSGPNALHAVDIKKKGKKVTFKTANDETITTDIVGQTKLNIGNGVMKTRTLVKLDMEYQDTHYKNVIFSLSDRTDNSHPALIGIKFLSQTKTIIDLNK